MHLVSVYAHGNKFMDATLEERYTRRCKNAPPQPVATEAKAEANGGKAE